MAAQMPVNSNVIAVSTHIWFIFFLEQIQQDGGNKSRSLFIQFVKENPNYSKKDLLVPVLMFDSETSLVGECLLSFPTA